MQMEGVGIIIPCGLTGLIRGFQLSWKRLSMESQTSIGMLGADNGTGTPFASMSIINAFCKVPHMTSRCVHDTLAARLRLVHTGSKSRGPLRLDTSTINRSIVLHRALLMDGLPVLELS